jgi:hypothetical protein
MVTEQTTKEVSRADTRFAEAQRLLQESRVLLMFAWREAGGAAKALREFSR